MFRTDCAEQRVALNTESVLIHNNGSWVSFECPVCLILGGDEGWVQHTCLSYLT